MDPASNSSNPNNNKVNTLDETTMIIIDILIRIKCYPTLKAFVKTSNTRDFIRASLNLLSCLVMCEITLQ